MTKNERSLQWVIAGIFFVVCFAFFQWIYPNHLFFKEQMRIFLYTTDYFISFWDEPAWLSCYVGNFLIQFFHLTVIGPLIVTCVLLLLWYYSMRVLRKFGNGNMVSIYALFPVALEWGLICRLSYSIASTLTLIFVLWLFLGYIRIKNKRTSVWVAFILLPIIYSMVGSRLFVFSLMVIFYEGAKNRKRWWFWLSLLLSSYLYPLFMRHFYGLSIEEARKYLNLLDATLFYHSWARSKEEQLKGEETLSMEKRLPRKSDWEREHDILMSISDYPGVLSSLVAEYPENKQALDYLLCYYLLNENLNSFKNAFDTYYKGKFEVVPRLYEEALVQVLSKSSDEEVAGYQIPQDVIENYQDYIHCKSGRKAKEELRERYSSTYWYYSDYIH